MTTEGPPDVLVVGGGPAGSTLAGLLARRGRGVLVLDRARFPRAKACGECLNPGAVAALERTGLLADVLALSPARLEGWDVSSDGGPVARGRFGGDAVGLAVDRARLDEALLRAARRRGARVREGVRVVEARPAEGSSLPAVRLGRECGGGWQEARVVVGADGLRSVVSRSLGLVGRAPRLRKLSLTLHVAGEGPPADRGRLALADGLTVGLAPLEEDARLWNATVVVDPARDGARVSSDPRAFAVDVLDRILGPWTGGRDVVSGPLASGPFDWPVPRPRAPGVVLVGDAAGYYDPLTGQGIFRALRGAELAAASIDRALGEGRVSDGPLVSYARTLRREMAPGRRVQRVVEGVVGKGALRRFAVGRLARAPGSLDALIRVTGDAAPARSLLAPRSWGPLLSSIGPA